MVLNEYKSDVSEIRVLLNPLILDTVNDEVTVKIPSKPPEGPVGPIGPRKHCGSTFPAAATTDFTLRISVKSPDDKPDDILLSNS